MKVQKSHLLVILVISALALGSIILMLFPDEAVVKEVVKSEISPNGKYQAVIFIDTGGNATVDFSEHVAILNKNDSISKNDKIKNVHTIFKGYHVNYIDVKWEDSDNLIVYHSYKKGIIKQETEKYGVNIKYLIPENGDIK